MELLNHKIFLALLGSLLLSIPPFPTYAQINTNPTGTSFSDITTVGDDGSIDLGEWGQEATRAAGYNVERQWTTGTQLPEIIKLGDLGSTRVSEYTIGEVARFTTGNPEDISLDVLKLLEDQTLGSLVEAIPDLEDLELRDVPVLYDLVSTELGRSLARSRRTVGDLLASARGDSLQELALDSIDLSNYTYNSIPGILDAQIGDFAGYKNASLSDIPGLPEIPITFLSSGLNPSLPPIVARVDIPLGEMEQEKGNTVTGSYDEGFKVPCEEDCEHVELTDIDGSGGGIITASGKQWISKNQKVDGGSGCIGWLNGGKEPTGRHPFGKIFKLVLEETNESEGTATFAAYFRFSISCGLFLGVGHSPYFIGPIPLFTLKEKDVIFLGLGDLNDIFGGNPTSGGSDTSPIPLPDRSQRPPEEVPEEVQDGQLNLRYPLQRRFRVTSEWGEREAPAPGASTFHRGIDIGAPQGEPIIASADGRVVSAVAELGTCGGHIRISHGVYQGITRETGVCHVNRIVVTPGQTVQAGDIIGYVGGQKYTAGAGASSGPHLHFMVYENGKLINPRETNIDF